MAGFASFGMPMGNDKSAAANKARKDALARITLLKKKEMDTPTYVAGETFKFLAPDPQLIKQGIMDPIGTVKGVGRVASYASPAANSIRLIDAVKDNRNDLSNVPMSLLQGVGKDFASPEVQQAMEIAGIFPTGKALSVPLKLAGKGAGVVSKGLLRGVEGAASRTSADALSAASGGLLRGSPVRAARGAPEPDEFDEIVNAAKAEDPTLGDVAPEGTAPAPFRSEADWDESMSVNYAKAVKKIMDDLEPSYQKLLDDGEDAEIIYPLIDDSIAALDSEIGNLTMRRYNHNDLEDFLGRVAAPDDYIVADGTLAKRADDLVHEIGVEYERWGVDPDVWLLDTQFNKDAAKSAAKKVDKLPDAVGPIRPALPLPQRFTGEADKVPDLSRKTDNQKIKIIREFLNPDIKKINVNTGAVGSVVGQADLEIQYSNLVLRGRLSKRSRDYGKPYDFNAQSRANTIIANREKEIGKQLSVENKTRIRQQEINRNTTEHRELIEAAAVNFKDEYDEAYNFGGMPEVLRRFEVAHIGTLTSGSRVEWSNVRLVPKTIHSVQGKKPWSSMYTLLVKREEGILKRKLTAAEKAAIKKKITLIR
jgi:hypothetical protein